MSRLSPSSTVTTRGEALSRFTILVATASVGLTIAPSAMPIDSGIPGMRWVNSTPSSTALSSTSSTDSAPIAVKSRRNSIVGRLTADEYSSGGRTPARIHSGSIWTVGICGRKLIAIPSATRISGAATRARGASAVTASMASTATAVRPITRWTSTSDASMAGLRRWGLVVPED